MLLSHNFQVSPEFLPALSREDFMAIFAAGLGDQMRCHLLDNPHWIVEILFPIASGASEAINSFTPQQVGELCGRALAAKRQPSSGKSDILVLGGLKTTPPTSDSPMALQPGNWGVDVVETFSGEEFLRSINWDTMIADKPAAAIFRVELSVGKS